MSHPPIRPALLLAALPALAATPLAALPALGGAASTHSPIPSTRSWEDVGEGRVRGHVAGLEATFEPGSAAFAAPALDGLPPLPVVFRLESVRRGGVLLTATHGARPLVEGDTVVLDHGAFEERYDARAAGVEQSFLFPAPVGDAGALVVRGRIETALRGPAPGEHPGGLTFALPGHPAVSFGAVTGIGADGAKAAGTMRFDGETLELELPASFVDGTTWPLVLDPLIGTSFEVTADSPATEDVTPDAAYDATFDRYLVVWGEETEGGLGGTDYLVRGRRVTGSGVPLGSVLTIGPQQMGHPSPAVGTCNQTNRFLVVWERSGLILSSQIVCAAVDALDGDVSPVVTIADGNGSAVAVGSESTTADNEVLVVWREGGFVSGLGIRGAQVTVPTSGNPIPFPEFVVTSSSTAGSPEISNGGGADGRFLVTYELAPDAIFTTYRLWARLFDRNGNGLTDSELIASESFPLTPCAVDGDGDEFIVAYTDRDAGDDSIVRAKRLRYSAPFGDLVPMNEWVVADPSGSTDASWPAVAWASDGHATIAWRQVLGSSDSVYVANFHVDTGLACDPATVVAGTSDSERVPRLAGAFAASATAGGRDLIVWQSDETVFSPFDADVRAHVYDPPQEGGVVSSQGGGCGSGGSASVLCGATPGNASFTHLLQGAEASTAAYLLLSLETLDAGCSGCVLVPDPFTGFVFGPVMTDADGRASLVTPLADSPALVGLTFFEQWAVVPGVSACAVLGADLSNALEITLQ